MLTKVKLIAVNTFKESVRNKALYSIFTFLALLLVVSSFFGKVSIGDRDKVIKDFGLFGLSFFSSIFVILTGSSLLFKEIKQKTIYNILSKSVDRWEFILGKFVGLFLSSAIFVLLSSLIFFVFLFFVSGKPDFKIFYAFIFILFEVFLMSSVTILFSSIVVTTSLSGIFSFSVFLVGKSTAYLINFIHTSTDISELTMLCANLLYFILPDLSLLSVEDLVSAGKDISGRMIFNALIYSVSYSAIVLFISTYIFKRRELN